MVFRVLRAIALAGLAAVLAAALLLAVSSPAGQSPRGWDLPFMVGQ